MKQASASGLENKNHIFGLGSNIGYVVLNCGHLCLNLLKTSAYQCRHGKRERLTVFSPELDQGVYANLKPQPKCLIDHSVSQMIGYK
jgi:hypothetical protein